MRFFARRVGRSSMWLALAVSSAAILSGCKAEAVDPRVDPPFVRTTLAAPSSPAGTRYAGVVVAKIESALAFQVAGKIVERLVATGDMVRKGQPLMRLDPRDYELAKVAADSAVTAARARAVQARADEARARSLVGTGAVSRTAYDQTKAAADTADAHLAQAEARARVARNEADYTTLLAGANGVIVETLAEPGQVVTAGQPVVRMAMAGPREARVALPESRLPPVGTVAQATIFASGSEHPAKLRQISGQADPQTRTFDARFTLSGEAAAAPLGASLTIEVPAQDKARQILVPLGAVTDRGGGPGVWVIVKHSAHSSEQPTVAWRPVSIGAVGAEKATVTRGLAAGERVVTMGAHLLHDGEKVRVDSAASSRADR